METCMICLEDIEITNAFWKCTQCSCHMHYQCKSVYNKKNCNNKNCNNKNCPQCNQKILNELHQGCIIRDTYGLVASIDPYLQQWSKQSCIQEKHAMILRKPFGVVIECLTCHKVESFNWINQRL